MCVYLCVCVGVCVYVCLCVCVCAFILMMSPLKTFSTEHGQQ